MVPETLHGDGDPPREGECYVWTGSPYPPEGLKTGFHNKKWQGTPENDGTEHVSGLQLDWNSEQVWKITGHSRVPC